MRSATIWQLTAPYAIASSLWLIILPLAGLTENASLSFTDWPLFLSAIGIFFAPSSIVSGFIVGFTPACLWQLSIIKPDHLTYVSKAVLWISLAITYLVMGLMNKYDSALTLIAPQVGIMLGLITALALSKTPALGLFLSRLYQPRAASKAILIVSVISIMYAIFLSALSQWEHLSLIESITTMPDFLYESYKQLMLWVPIGMIFAFSPKQAQIGYWILAGLCSYLLISSFSTFSITAHNYLEISFASLGCLAGLWMGSNFKKTSKVQTEKTNHLLK